MTEPDQNKNAERLKQCMRGEKEGEEMEVEIRIVSKAEVQGCGGL